MFCRLHQEVAWPLVIVSPSTGHEENNTLQSSAAGKPTGFCLSQFWSMSCQLLIAIRWHCAVIMEPFFSVLEGGFNWTFCFASILKSDFVCDIECNDLPLYYFVKFLRSVWAAQHARRTVC